MTNFSPPPFLSLTAAGLILLFSTPAGAAPERPLRDLSTDRPDTTESPRSVDAGHFQFELELAAWEQSGPDRVLNLGELNLKAGLTDSTDLQLVLPLYSRTAGGEEEGFGDLSLRLKYNLWGNDGGATALAVMPYVKLPTAHDGLGNGKVEGGLIFPFAFGLPGGWDAGLMTEIDLAADDPGHGWHVILVQTATVSHDLTENTGFFIELAGILNTETGAGHEAYFNAGLTWAPSPCWQLDGGLRTGLTSASVDLTPFLGLSAKF